MTRGTAGNNDANTGNSNVRVSVGPTRYFSSNGNEADDDGWITIGSTIAGFDTMGISQVPIILLGFHRKITAVIIQFWYILNMWLINSNLIFSLNNLMEQLELFLTLYHPETFPDLGIGSEAMRPQILEPVPELFFKGVRCVPEE